MRSSRGSRALARSRGTRVVVRPDRRIFTGMREQPWPIRLTHWANAILLPLMAMSGLQILAAYPEQGPRGATYRWYLLSGWVPPEFVRLGGWLAGARHWHFAVAWLFVLNALAYVAFLVASGAFRQRLFWPPRDARHALRTFANYLRFAETPPNGLYNGLQRLAYTAALLLGLIVAATGLVLFKPVQLGWLAALFGGYDAARAIHLLSLAALLVFTAGHVLMVLIHPRTLIAMITGGRRRGTNG